MMLTSGDATMREAQNVVKTWREIRNLLASNLNFTDCPKLKGVFS